MKTTVFNTIFAGIFILLSVFFNELLYSEKMQYQVPVLFLNSFSAREMAMADAVTGIADNINTISVNPAGLNTLNTSEVSATYLKYLLNINYGHFTAGTPVVTSSLNSYLAFSTAFFYTDNITFYNETGYTSPLPAQAHDLVLNIGYALNPFQFLNDNRNFNLGLNLKFLNTELSETPEKFSCLDLGILYKFHFISISKKNIRDNFGIGIACQNLVLKGEESSSPFFIPQKNRIGISYNLLKNDSQNILFGLDLISPVHLKTVACSGIEYSYRKASFIRIGYKFLNSSREKITLGAGSQFSIKKNSVFFDYTFIPLENVTIKHIITLSMKFDSIDYFMKRDRNITVISLKDRKNLLFDTSFLTKNGCQTFKDLADEIKKIDYKRISIRIYPINYENSDIELSQLQAKEIKKYFIEQNINSQKISCYSYIFSLPDQYVQLFKAVYKQQRYEIYVEEWLPEEKIFFTKYYQNGLQAYQIRDYQTAVQEWQKALKYDPRNSEILDYLHEIKK